MTNFISAIGLVALSALVYLLIHAASITSLAALGVR